MRLISKNERWIGTESKKNTLRVNNTSVVDEFDKQFKGNEVTPPDLRSEGDKKQAS